MGKALSHSTVEILRSTLKQLEDAAEELHEDPAMFKVKRQIVRAIADLEIAKENAELGTTRLEARHR
jgi:hypothetical protein